MPWGIPPELFAGTTLLTIISGFVYALMRGHLVPSGLSEKIEKEYAKREELIKAELEAWKTAYKIEAAGNDRLVDQIRELTRAQEVTNQILAALPIPPRREINQ